MILTADWHLREETVDTVLEVMDRVVDFALRRGERDLVHLGDLFQHRNRYSVPVLNALLDALRRHRDESGVSWTLLPGNHDQCDASGRNVLEVLDELDGVRVKTEPGWDELGLWVPYRKDLTKVEEALSLTRPNRVPKVAYLHVGVVGALMNTDYRNEDGLGPLALSGFDLAFSGHYHRHQKVGNLVYVGSPYQTRADEAGQQKGVIHSVDGVWEFVPLEVGKRYHHLEVSSLEDLSSLDLSGVSLKDEVRIRAGVGVDPGKVSRAVESVGVKNVIVTPDQPEPRERLVVPEGNKTLRAYAEAYVSTDESGLDKVELMRTFDELTGGG